MKTYLDILEAQQIELNQTEQKGGASCLDAHNPSAYGKEVIGEW